MKKTGLAVLVMLMAVLSVMVIRTLMFRSHSLDLPAAAPLTLDREAVLARLSSAVRLETVSAEAPGQADPAPFLAFQDLLDRSFPAIARTLEKEVINGQALVYKWPGRNPDLLPGALLAHYDVVPVARETLARWQHPPFGGDVGEGFVWGRGTLDMKGTLMAILESVEALAGQGFVPDRTLYLAFGQDEEVGGKAGAARIAEHFQQAGVRLAFTLDEGMVILNPALSPSGQQVAVIGVAEKGYATLEITAQGQGGHSSMPPRHTAVGELAAAAASLEANPMPASLSGPVGLFFDAVGPGLPFAQRLLFANQWAFEPLLVSVLEKKVSTNAMIRTTTALTMIQGGIKENVLPDQARLLVNFRLLPGDTGEAVLAHAQKVIGNDRIKIRFHNDWVNEASPVSATDSEAFAALSRTVAQVFGNTPSAPGLVLAATDSKHYTAITDNCYRFSPFVFGPEDLPRIHGVNERVSVEGYLKAILFYARFIEAVCGAKGV